VDFDVAVIGFGGPSDTPNPESAVSHLAVTEHDEVAGAKRQQLRTKRDGDENTIM